MSKTSPKPKRILTNFELSAEARAALTVVAEVNGWTKTKAVEQAIFALHANGTFVPLLSRPGLPATRRQALIAPARTGKKGVAL